MQLLVIQIKIKMYLNIKLRYILILKLITNCI